jgi:hypothetical protein
MGTLICANRDGDGERKMYEQICRVVAPAFFTKERKSMIVVFKHGGRKGNQTLRYV